MLPKNRQHLKRVLVWGGGVSAVLAGMSLLKFPPGVALGILTGAAMGLFSLYSIVMVVEALVGAAASGPGAGRASKTLATLSYIIKLALMLAALILLVVFKLMDLMALIGFLAGFTVVLLANIVAGLLTVKEDAGKTSV